MELKYHKERGNRTKLEERIAKLILAHKAEKVDIMNKAQEEAKVKFNEKIKSYQEVYDKELDNVKSQFYDIRNAMIQKDMLASKLLQMLADQEKLLSHIKQMLKINGLGNIQIESLAKPVVNKEEVDDEILTLKGKLVDMRFNYQYLKEDYQNLREINLKTTDDWSIAAHRVKDLEAQISKSQLTSHILI